MKKIIAAALVAISAITFTVSATHAKADEAYAQKGFEVWIYSEAARMYCGLPIPDKMAVRIADSIVGYMKYDLETTSRTINKAAHVFAQKSKQEGSLGEFCDGMLEAFLPEY